MNKLILCAASCALAACAATETIEPAPRLSAAEADAVSREDVLVVEADPTDESSAPECRRSAPTGSRITSERCLSPGELARAEGVGGREAVEEFREVQRQRETSRRR